MAEQRLINGRYRLDEVVGSGGMGVVWRAYDLRLSRSVAVKEIRFPSTLSDSERDALTKRALVEAQSAGRLDHRNIVAVHDVVVEDDRPYIIMRLVDGVSLDRLVAREGPLTPERAATIGLELLDALGAAHAADIVHRDVKPQNVLVNRDGTALLTDFSIAAVVGSETLTRTGVLLGSPGYIPPERLISGQVGPAGDLFALGATLFFAVEGVGPFAANEMFAGLFAIATQPHPRPERAGPLTPLLDGLLVKSPDDRLSPERARALLTDVAHGSTTRAGEFSPPPDLAATRVRPASASTNDVDDDAALPAEDETRVAAASRSAEGRNRPQGTMYGNRQPAEIRGGVATGMAVAIGRPTSGAPNPESQGDPPNDATTAAFAGAPVRPVAWQPGSGAGAPSGPGTGGTGGPPPQSPPPARPGGQRWKKFAAALVILVLATAAGVIGSLITTAEKTEGTSGTATSAPPTQPPVTYTSPTPTVSASTGPTDTAPGDPTPSPTKTSPTPSPSTSTSTVPPVPEVVSATITLAKTSYTGDCSSFKVSATATIKLSSGPSDVSWQLREGGGQADNGNAHVTAKNPIVTKTSTFQETNFRNKKITFLLTIQKPHYFDAVKPQVFTVNCIDTPPPTTTGVTP